MNHCNKDFQPYETWYLKDIKPKGETFTSRTLKLGICPVCKCTVVELTERRLRDEKIFPNTYTKKDALHVIELNKDKIMYTSLEVKARKKVSVTMPQTIRYGENKIVKIGKETRLRQRAKSFRTGSELIKEVRI